MTSKLKLTRFASDDTGTRGRITVEGKQFCTLELPWRGNQRKVSCIPPGTYAARIVDSPKFGKVYEVQGVPGRSEILIHWGNWAGDVSRGLKSDVLGCILLGASFASVLGQAGVTTSHPSVTAFMTALGGQDFTLEVIDETQIG